LAKTEYEHRDFYLALKNVSPVVTQKPAEVREPQPAKAEASQPDKPEPAQPAENTSSS